MTTEETAAETLTKTLLAEIADQRDIIAHLEKKAVADNALIAALELKIEILEDGLSEAEDKISGLESDLSDAELDAQDNYDTGYADGEEAAKEDMDIDEAKRVLTEVLEDIQRYKPLYDHFMNKNAWFGMVKLVGGEVPNYRIPMYFEE